MSEARSELEELRAALAASEQRAAAAEAEVARAGAVVSTSEAMIAGLKLEIALLKRDKFGRSAERSAKLLDQMELQLEELVADAAEDRVQAERKTTRVDVQRDNQGELRIASLELFPDGLILPH